ncbi:hypothetical protein AB4K20DRAFT_1875145 [Rhizopus microsporus]
MLTRLYAAECLLLSQILCRFLFNKFFPHCFQLTLACANHWLAMWFCATPRTVNLGLWMPEYPQSRMLCRMIIALLLQGRIILSPVFFFFHYAS